MKNKLLFFLSFVGILAGIGAAIYFGITKAPLPPVFAPASDPYVSGIYAEGIVESVQPSGENINVYPEINGVVTKIFVKERGFPPGDSRRCRANRGGGPRPGFHQLKNEIDMLPDIAKGLVLVERGSKHVDQPESKNMDVDRFKKIIEEESSKLTGESKQ